MGFVPFFTPCDNNWEMSTSDLLVLSLSIFVILVPALQENVFAEEYFSFSKTLDVEKQLLQDTLIDVKNYERVFPNFIKSADVLEKDEDKVVAELSLAVGIVPVQIKVEHNVVNENTHELQIVSGDLSGTTIITTLKKTWGFDGTPEKGTIVDMDLDLQVSGFLAWLGIIDEKLIHYSLDSSLLRLGDYSKGDSVNSKSDSSGKRRR